MEDQKSLTGKRILLGITGCIGAYKSAELLREMIRQGAEVSVVMTESATRFITPLTFETLSGNPVGLEMFSLGDEREINHIDRAAWADVMVVAPGTANYLSKAANGIADDLLSTTTLAIQCPLVIAPAMNSKMWANSAVQANVDLLISRGVEIVQPGEGELACGEVGVGRLADIDEIMEGVIASVDIGDLAGMKILVTGGPTREPIDDVRYITNKSSGKMAYSIAGAASERGAEVTMITGPTFLEVPPGVNAVHIKTAGEMLSSVVSQIDQNEWLIMVAAVADFTPEAPGKGKIKKDGKESLNLKLVATRDILNEVKKSREGKLLVGFAAETEDMDKNAVVKLKSKELDLIVANDVSRDGAGFESDNNQAVIFCRDGEKEDLPLMPKREMAHRILDASLRVWMKKQV